MKIVKILKPFGVFMGGEVIDFNESMPSNAEFFGAAVERGDAVFVDSLFEPEPEPEPEAPVKHARSKK
jgi:hypothetical protein